MLSNTQKYKWMIQEATNQYMLFPKMDNQGKKSTITWESDFILPSTYPFRTSQQIQKNILINHPAIEQTSTQGIQNFSISSNNWPQSCIGLVLCEHHQNNQIYYVYGTGTLIYNNIVITSTQNVYCRRLNTEYINIKFITGVSGNKCSGIYDVMRMYYPMDYTKQEGYKNYFVILSLYDDLSKSCGHVGWKTNYKIQGKQKDIRVYGYLSDGKQGCFSLKQLKKYQKLTQIKVECSGSGELLKEGNQYFIVGLYIQQIRRYRILSQLIRNMIKEWTKRTIFKKIHENFKDTCNQIVKYTKSDLKMLILQYNSIDVEGCKYLSQAKWGYIDYISLYSNDIKAQGCQYLSQANWTQLTHLNLYNNNIGSQGCKFLSQANWIHLTNLDLYENNIGVQGCKYLSEANWRHLNSINLHNNKVGSQGCKFLSQANWSHLTNINLTTNNIGAQGIKYISQANWTYLTSIYLNYNNIIAQGCKYIIQNNWPHLNYINLYQNNIDKQGYKYLRQAKWTYSINIDLRYNIINNFIDIIILKELWSKIQF